MLLSVIIPVYNEKESILEVLEQVRNVDIDKEIIVVDDCSTDGTRDLLKDAGSNTFEDMKILFHDMNKGKGAAFRTGLKEAAGDFVIIQDADSEYDPGDYLGLLEPLMDGRADVVYGSRFKGAQKSMTLTQYLGNRTVTLATRVLYATDLSDEATCYKVFKRDIIQGIPFEADRFNFEPEITAKLLKKGIKIYEVPISYNARQYKQGKKITWRDGVSALWTLAKYRFKR